MSRRKVRGETCRRAASSVPGQYRRDCSSDSSRSVRVLVFAIMSILVEFRSESGRYGP